jgi:hypothetical protein
MDQNLVDRNRAILTKFGAGKCPVCKAKLTPQTTVFANMGSFGTKACDACWDTKLAERIGPVAQEVIKGSVWFADGIEHLS